MEEGKFVVFEGLDKSGKETQARLLVDHLKSKGLRAVYTEEPNPHNMMGRMIRDWLNRKYEIQSGEAVALLYTADRQEHLKTFILPNLKEGISVVSDRYFYSTIAYQSVLYGVDGKWIRDVNRFARKPDLVIFLDVSPEESVRRTRANDRHENLDFQKRVREAYMDLAEREGFEIIDGNRGKEEISNEIKKKVSEILGI